MDNELNAELARAAEADGYMVAIWRLSNGVLHLYRKTHAFPVGDFPIGIDLLKKNLTDEGGVLSQSVSTTH